MDQIKASNATFLDDNTGGKGKYFRARILQAGLVKYSFGVCLLEKDTIDRFVYNFVGCPVIIDHKDVTNENAKEERVGVISRVWFEQMDGWYWVEGIIFDEKAISLINDGYNVSCQYEISEYANNVGKKLHNGNSFDKVILNGKPEHLAIVKNPRYENAMIAVNALDATNKDDEKGRWVTIKGTHIFIKDGQSVEDAMKEHGFDESSDKEKSDGDKSGDEPDWLKQERKKLDRQTTQMYEDREIIKKDENYKREADIALTMMAHDYEKRGNKGTVDRANELKEKLKKGGELTEKDKADIKTALDTYKPKEKSGDDKDYKPGDKITFDTNWRGVSEKLKEGTIIGKEKKLGIKGDANPDYQYKVKTDDGKTILVEKEAIKPKDKGKQSDDKIKQYEDKIPKNYRRNEQTKALWLYKNSYITRKEWEEYRDKARNAIIQAINEIKETDMFKNLFKKKENKMDKDELKSLFMECLSELTAKNEADEEKEDEKLADEEIADNEDDMKDEKKDEKKADNKCKNEVVDKRDIIRQIMAIAGKEEASEDVKTIAKLAEKLAYDKSEADKKADNKCKNEDDKDEDKKVENEEKEEKEDVKEKASNSLDEIIGKMSAGTFERKSEGYLTQKKAVELGDKLF